MKSPCNSSRIANIKIYFHLLRLPSSFWHLLTCPISAMNPISWISCCWLYFSENCLCFFPWVIRSQIWNIFVPWICPFYQTLHSYSESLGIRIGISQVITHLNQYQHRKAEALIFLFISPLMLIFLNLESIALLLSPLQSKLSVLLSILHCALLLNSPTRLMPFCCFYLNAYIFSSFFAISVFLVLTQFFGFPYKEEYNGY